MPGEFEQGEIATEGDWIASPLRPVAVGREGL
jgi:hypothetical protein